MVTKVTYASLTGNGLRDWLIQRISSLILFIYILLLVGFFSLHHSITTATLGAFFAHPWMRLFSLIALLCLFFHAWVGIMTIIADYIKLVSIRLLVQVLVILLLITYFVWGIAILWG